VGSSSVEDDIIGSAGVDSVGIALMPTALVVVDTGYGYDE